MLEPTLVRMLKVEESNRNTAIIDFEYNEIGQHKNPEEVNNARYWL